MRAASMLIVLGKDSDGRDEFLEVRAHAQLAKECASTFDDVGAGSSLVVAQRRDAGVRKRLGEEPATAVGAREQGRAPVTIGGPAASDQYDSRKWSVVGR
jgi:hypothetical protein